MACVCVSDQGEDWIIRSIKGATRCVRYTKIEPHNGDQEGTENHGNAESSMSNKQALGAIRQLDLPIIHGKSYRVSFGQISLHKRHVKGPDQHAPTKVCCT
jgi:hypothetical protein